MAVVLGAGLLTVPAAARQVTESAHAQQPLTATRLAGFGTGHTAVRVGGAAWDSATVLPHGVRTVRLQYRRAGAARFTTMSTAGTSPLGVVSLGLQPPSAGTWQFRAVVAATARATGLVSPTRTVTASGPAATTLVTGLATTHATVGLGETVLDDVVVRPRTSRVVLVQARRPGSSRFVTQSTGRASRTGNFRAVFRPTSPGAWRFRLVVPASATARSTTSAARQVTVLDSAAGGSTTASSTTPGSTSPATTTAGSGTGGTGTGGAGTGTGGTGTGTGGTGGTGTGGGTTGGPTQPATTTAALAVRVAGYPNATPNNKLTVAVPFAFDASASLAADGRTLESATLDYGDGQSDTIDAPNGPLDYWNTLHAYATTGSKTVSLKVTDSAGTTDTTSVTVHVYDLPSASLRVASGPAQVGVPVTLAMSADTPAGTQLSSYSLVVSGEGIAGVDPSSEHFILTDDTAPPATRDLTFTMPGSYTVSLRVENDADGSPDVETISFEVAP